MTINEERVRKWIAALRSGEYPQARRSLRKGDCFCALGVCCDVYRKETGEGEWQKWSSYDRDWYFCNADIVLPSQVYFWYGFEDPDPLLYGKTRVSDLNDHEKMNFNEIADRLEEFFFPSRV